MSGTSLDGVDVALVELGGVAERPEPARLANFRSFPYEPELRSRLRALIDGDPLTLRALCELNFELGRCFAGATSDALAGWGIPAAAVAAIGSHGQTVWHVPPSPNGPGSTLQIGEGAVIAERTGIPVVCDFRVRDMAAGGHGAPLTPYFDHLLLGSAASGRAIQNIGGMANVTALPPAGGEAEPLAFDTGPGVALLDAAADWLSGGVRAMDRDGELAARGTVLEVALEEWLEDPFFRQQPPRSTGREHFSGARLTAWLERHREASPEELLATLTELTARTIADAYARIGFEMDEVYVCGGGARNPELLRRLGERLAPRRMFPLEGLGWNGDAREAAAFALLARQHRLGIPASLPWATGARAARVLGKMVPA